jgi:hypothetical protein
VPVTDLLAPISLPAFPNRRSKLQILREYKAAAEMEPKKVKPWGVSGELRVRSLL